MGGVVLLVFIGQGVAAVVLGADHQTRLALQFLLILGLQPVEAVVVRSHAADDVGRQRAIGIVALGIGLQIHAVDLVVIEELPDGVGRVLVHPELHHLVLGVGALHLLQNTLLRHTQQLTQAGGETLLGPLGLRLFQLLRQFLGREEHRLRRGRYRQLVAVAVVDGAS